MQYQDDPTLLEELSNLLAVAVSERHEQCEEDAWLADMMRPHDEYDDAAERRMDRQAAAAYELSLPYRQQDIDRFGNPPRL